MKRVVCFGEVLWDVLLDGRKPGGAPMNVAYHLNKLGIQGDVISRVGNDVAGKELLHMLSKIGLSTRYIQRDEVHKTSEVLARMDNKQEMHYEIVKPVAWDFIVYDEVLKKLVETADVLVFGSLVARNEVARHTLYELIDRAKFRLFDVNLREPHYTRETIEYLLRKADAVKLNNHELAIIGRWMGLQDNGGGEIVACLQQNYGLQEVIITKGADGASYYTLDSRYDYSAYPVKVKDTIGSGDSFLAAFLAQKLLGKSIADILDFASALGAYVTAQAGANPAYEQTDLHHFIWQKQLERWQWK